MILTLEEKEKLLEKAKSLYENIKMINTKKDMYVELTPKYYDNNSRYSSCGFKYYLNGTMSIYCNGVKNMISELENYIFSKKTGEKYLDGKLISFISDYTINALLDFIYYSNTILNTIKKNNEEDRKELNALLN